MEQEKADLAKRIGDNLKALRTEVGLTPKRLAEETNLSPAFFSRLEKGTVMPSIATLQTIADVLKVDIESFFRRDAEKGYVISRSEERRFVQPKGKPYGVSLLAENMENPFMEPFLVSLPRKDKEGETEFTIHEGQEFCYCLEGTMELTLGDQKFTLKKGDAAYWNGIIPHKGTSLTDEKAITLHVHLIPGKRRRVRSRESEIENM